MKKMDLAELAQYTYQGLKRRGLYVTLSGGACVSLYTRNAYLSGDLDFIGRLGQEPRQIASTMKILGFRKEGRHFVHPSSDFFVEFPPPPLAVGEQALLEVGERAVMTRRGKIGVRMLSPTDCVKDRLCGYFHWNDRQTLDQAVWVAKARKVDLKDIRKWAKAEGMVKKYGEFLKLLAAVPRKKRSHGRP